MLQRIQTLFLLVSSIFLAFCLFFPFAELIRGSDQVLFQLDIHGLSASQNADETLFTTLPLGILAFVSLALHFIIIFLYRKRMLQIRLSVFLIILLLGLPALTYYYIRMAELTIAGTASYSLTFILPIASAILIFLALRAIARDEALVRSLDRLR